MQRTPKLLRPKQAASLRPCSAAALMVGDGWSGWHNAAKRLWRAAFGWEADANAEADGTCADARGGHHNKDTGEVDNDHGPARKKQRTGDGSAASKALVAPEGDASSPSAASGAPALSLPAAFPSAGFAGIVADIEALRQRTDRIENAAKAAEAAEASAEAEANAAAARGLGTIGYGNAGLLHNQHASIEALMHRINRAELLLAEVDTPQMVFNYRSGCAAEADTFERRLDTLTQQMAEVRTLVIRMNAQSQFFSTAPPPVAP